MLLKKERFCDSKVDPNCSETFGNAMGRLGQRKHVSDVQREFAGDFTVINDSLLLCKFCDTVVNWKKKTRIYEHLQTRMHSEKKEAKLSQTSGTTKFESQTEKRDNHLQTEEISAAFQFSPELELDEPDPLASKIKFKNVFFYYYFPTRLLGVFVLSQITFKLLCVHFLFPRCDKSKLIVTFMKLKILELGCIRRFCQPRTIFSTFTD